MSFEAAWGFDPEKALQAQKRFQRVMLRLREAADDNTPRSGEPQEDIGIPAGSSAQIYELCRLFRS